MGLIKIECDSGESIVVMECDEEFRMEKSKTLNDGDKLETSCHNLKIVSVYNKIEEARNKEKSINRRHT